MKCGNCNGTGRNPSDKRKCFFCNGSGEMCDSCGEAMTTDDMDLGTGCCQQCEDEQAATHSPE